jgi:hypothetical protein
MLSLTATAAEVRQVNAKLAAYVATVLHSNRKKFSLYKEKYFLTFALWYL